MDTTRKPIRYVDTLTQKYGAMGFPAYDWSRYDDAPFTPLTKSLSQCPRRRVAYYAALADAVAAEAPSDDFQIHDSYYDHSDADRDLNCIFPLDRLRELAAAGDIGAVAPRHWSGFMGRIYKRQAVMQEKAPELVRRLKEDRVDLLIAIPA